MVHRQLRCDIEERGAGEASYLLYVTMYPASGKHVL